MISIIIPIVREEKAEKLVKALKEYKTDIPFEIVKEIDLNHIGCPLMVKWLTQRTKYDWVLFLGDDTVPEPGFLEAAYASIFSLKSYIGPTKWILPVTLRRSARSMRSF